VQVGKLSKQTHDVYIALKSTNKSRAHFSPEPAWGLQSRYHSSLYCLWLLTGHYKLDRDYAPTMRTILPGSIMPLWCHATVLMRDYTLQLEEPCEVSTSNLLSFAHWAEPNMAW